MTWRLRRFSGTRVPSWAWPVSRCGPPSCSPPRWPSGAGCVSGRGRPGALGGGHPGGTTHDDRATAARVPEGSRLPAVGEPADRRPTNGSRARTELMSSLAVSGIIFACLLGGALLGMLLRGRLPEGHLSADTKEVVKLATGILGTMAALVLGLLVATAKGSFDTQRNGVAQLAANVIVMDRTLAHYGKEAQPTRELL